jgi:hypothetical protein
MSKSQTVIWTALPRYVDTVRGVLGISVHIAPRLETGGPDDTLADFTDWLDWPGTAKSFAVSFGGGSPHPATIVTNPAAASKYWKALFKSTTFVRGRDPSTVVAPQLPVRSYPVSRALGYVQSKYTALLQSSPTDPATTQSLMGLVGDIAISDSDRARYIKQLDDQVLSSQRAFQFGNTGPPGALDMIALERFYRRGGNVVPSPLIPPKIDVHDRHQGHPHLDVEPRRRQQP